MIGPRTSQCLLAEPVILTSAPAVRTTRSVQRAAFGGPVVLLWTYGAHSQGFLFTSSRGTQAPSGFGRATEVSDKVVRDFTVADGEWERYSIFLLNACSKQCLFEDFHVGHTLLCVVTHKEPASLLLLPPPLGGRRACGVWLTRVGRFLWS